MQRHSIKDTISGWQDVADVAAICLWSSRVIWMVSRFTLFYSPGNRPVVWISWEKNITKG